MLVSMIDRVPDQRILKGTPATLSVVLHDYNGEIDASIDSGVTITLTRLSGTVIATAAAATTTADGAATYTLTAAQTADLDVISCAWTHNSVVRATSLHEVVGRFFFAPSALRERRGVVKAQTTGPGDHTSGALIAARTWVENLIEWATGVAWVPRTALDYLTSNGSGEVMLRHLRPRTLTSITINGTAETVSDYVVEPWGVVRRADGGGITASDQRGFVVRYEHGYDTPPQDLVDAALTAAADRLFSERTSMISPRQTSFGDGSGAVFSLAAVNPENPTGIREVDRAIRAYNHRTPGLA